MTREEFSLLLAGIDWTRMILAFMVGSIMSLRHDPLPQGAAQLTRIILSLNEENADLKARVAFLEGQLFGTKSEKITTIDPTQAILDLGDLSDIPVAANADVAPVRDRIIPARRQPARNIGHLTPAALKGDATTKSSLKSKPDSVINHQAASQITNSAVIRGLHLMLLS
jgi:Transposase C of IS166 homeodomain